MPVGAPACDRQAASAFVSPTCVRCLLDRAEIQARDAGGGLPDTGCRGVVSPPGGQFFEQLGEGGGRTFVEAGESFGTVDPDDFRGADHPLGVSVALRLTLQVTTGRHG